MCLYKGTRLIASKGKEITNWKAHMLFLCGNSSWHSRWIARARRRIHLGAPFPRVGNSATGSKCNIDLCEGLLVLHVSCAVLLLKRFPIPYGNLTLPIVPSAAATFFVLVATIAAFTGQHVVRVISFVGRASIIIFILALSIFVSAISLGGAGIANMLKKLENQEYLGFQNLCNQTSIFVVTTMAMEFYISQEAGWEFLIQF
ncbi:sulfite exporter TauE/SafE family protein [Actinidia rufa]|uniref:Sulfite exporter TauE/SafE family protein n=1 Tax=Actinidia rufa TaxID=165716 RepID=A0A7J0H6E2_9ERIC|nr:sulfite exporter TauE/SafE family protein [Actinidia rufa]